MVADIRAVFKGERVNGFKPHEMLERCCHEMRFESCKCVIMHLWPGSALDPAVELTASPPDGTSSWIWEKYRKEWGRYWMEKGKKEGMREKDKGRRQQGKGGNGEGM